jgi:hypothetical protein
VKHQGPDTVLLHDCQCDVNNTVNMHLAIKLGHGLYLGNRHLIVPSCY